MSPSFWVWAGVLAALAVAFLVVPLWRARGQGGLSLSGVVASVATIPVAVGIYLAINTWAPEPTADIPPEQAAMVERLAERMASNPNDVDGWLLLGRSYMVLGQYGLGRQAYMEAWERTAVPDNGLKVALGEALILSNRGRISGEAASLIEEVLAEDPANQKALWYGGLVAVEQGRQDVACTRWQGVLAANPPPEVAESIRGALTRLSCGGALASAEEQGTVSGPAIRLQVRLGAGHSLEGLGPNAALFIFARAPGGGPPLAVIRQPVSSIPGEFTLSDANAMITGRSLADFPELSLVARVSKSGQPTEQPGDLYAEAQYAANDEGPVDLVIDQVVP